MLLPLLGCISIGIVAGWLSVLVFYGSVRGWWSVLFNLLFVVLLCLQIFYFLSSQSLAFFLVAYGLSFLMHWLWKLKLMNNL